MLIIDTFTAGITIAIIIQSCIHRYSHLGLIWYDHLNYYCTWVVWIVASTTDKSMWIKLKLFNLLYRWQRILAMIYCMSIIMAAYMALQLAVWLSKTLITKLSSVLLARFHVVAIGDLFIRKHYMWLLVFLFQ